MPRLHLALAPLTLFLCLFLCLAPPALAGTLAVYEAGQLQSASGKAVARQSGSCADTLVLYGGPGTPEGKFQLANGVTADAQGWTGVDMTDLPNPWQVDSYMSPTGTAAAWCGRSAAQEPGWSSAPGYGNGWDAWLVYESPPVPDPAAGQVVQLDFLFNHDTEPGYDFFHVDYDSAGSWVTVYTRDGNNLDTNGVAAPLAYGTLPGTKDIRYAGSDYAGGDRVRIRLRVTSDNAWSDEDGLWSSSGAVQVDDIVVQSTAGVSTSDFEAGFGDWQPHRQDFVGDFFKVFTRVEDIDVCRSNASPVAGFIDDGSPVGNPGAAAHYGTDSTGGEISYTWTYGIPGGWVVNYNSGLAGGYTALHNEMWSPPIAWDLPGSCDDGVDWAGGRLDFDAYTHQPLSNGLCWIWHVRFSDDGGTSWTDWRDEGFFYYSGTPIWQRASFDLTPYVEPGATHVQLSLGLRDASFIFGFPGDDATVSPIYDNVAVRKYRIGGPSQATRTIDLFQDSFPAGGSIDASTQAARDQLDIRVDMARDVSTGRANIPGDSIIVDLVPVIPGSTVDVASSRLVWVLDRNPLFDDVRTMPAGATSVAGGAANGWDQWTGSVAADQSTTSAGQPIADRYFFDLPDEGFLHPGDELRYYVQAFDTDGRSSTLPADIAGFADGDDYPRRFIVRGLPSLVDDGAGGVTQPSLLFINDFGHRGGESEYESAFAQLGHVRGVSFDVYTVQGPTSGVSNGIGGRANTGQLAGYSCLVYVSGNLSNFVMSNGTDTSNNDKGNDIGVLRAWHELPGDRGAAFFGDGLASDLITDGGTQGNEFLQQILSLYVNDDNVGDEIGGQTAPRVVPEFAAFQSPYIAFGGCPGINEFDSLTPFLAGVRGHAWTGPDGSTTYPGLAASVVHDRIVGSDRKVDVLFAHDLLYVRDPVDEPGTAPALSARTVLLGEVLDLIGGHTAGGTPTPADLPSLHDHAQLEPTPFNPATTIHWRSGTASRNRVVVYDARGRQLAVLLDEERPAGPQALRWDGRDATGRAVASGVYLFEVVADGRSVVRKGVLLK